MGVRVSLVPRCSPGEGGGGGCAPGRHGGRDAIPTRNLRRCYQVRKISGGFKMKNFCGGANRIHRESMLLSGLVLLIVNMTLSNVTLNFVYISFIRKIQ